MSWTHGWWNRISSPIDVGRDSLARLVGRAGGGQPVCANDDARLREVEPTLRRIIGESLGVKSERIEGLTERLGALLRLAPETVDTAKKGARLAKCDLVSLMVGEFPDLQGTMGREYARLSGEPPVDRPRKDFPETCAA